MSSGSSGPRPGALAGIVAGVALLAVAAFMFLRGDRLPDGGDKPGGAAADTQNPGDPDHTAQPASYAAGDYATFYALRNKGLAWLENKEFPNAIRSFDTLHQALPAERMPLQNFALGRALAVVDDDSPLAREKQENPALFQDAAEDARQTARLLAKFDKALAKYIEGRVDLKLGNSDAGIRLLHEAAQLEPKNAAFWFALYDAHADLRERADRTPYPLAVEAIENALALAPENLHAIGEAIQTQAKAGKTEALIATLQAARPVVEPLAESIQTRTRFDILKGFHRAIESLRTDPRRGAAFAMQIANVLRPDVAKRIDQRILDKNLLEYVMFDFSDNFRQAAAKAGYKPEADDPIEVQFTTIGGPLSGVSIARAVRIIDFDLDGFPDIVALEADRVVVLSRDNGRGEWTPRVSHTFPKGTTLSGMILVDLDRDYEVSSASKAYRVVHEGPGVPDTTTTPGFAFYDTDPDIVAWGPSGVFLLQNNKTDAGKRELTPLDEATAAFAGLQDVTAVVAVDIEHDGDLDLAVGSTSGLSLGINQSSRKAVRFARSAGSISGPPAKEAITGLAAADYNRDVANDLIVSGNTSSGILHNILHGRLRYTEIGDLPQAAAGMTVAEFNGDAAWDLAVASPEGITVLLLASTSDESMQWKSVEHVSQTPASGCLQCDYDNDTYRDLIAWGPQGVSILRGKPEGKFAPADIMDSKFLDVRDCDAADLDLDGDEDLIVSTADGVMVLINEGGNTNNWFRLTLRPEPNPEQHPANRVNMHGLGSVLEMKSAARYQAQVVERPLTHFGLGLQTRADALRIIWTDGVPQNIVDEPAPEASLTVLAPQFLKTSCPYIYTWDGEKFVFYSDCLWAAPLGLQLAEGVFAPSREWEYIRIDGQSLKPRNGEYVLQLTEELWEATYLDEVRLIAVDHPAGTQIFSNEKVGPPDVTEFRIHTVRTPRLPQSAVNQNGRDLLPQLSAADGQYVRAFDRRLRQGVTNEHFIEFDLGPLDKPQKVVLFLVGWVIPTDTNLNIAMQQSGEAPPRPPSILVPDEQGSWTEAVPFAGFPGGKTKTIAIDLSGKFLTDDYRVRLATSMELYWDAAFFTVDEEPVPVKQTNLPLLSANLHYRGFSRRTFTHSAFTPGSGGYAPEGYVYENPSRAPAWPPMQGRFTRFGEVRELLSDTDDFQVVFGAGDEITLRFADDDAELPQGWVRDFLLYNVGWDKDANQNTVFGQTVEPLPFRGMTGYPFAADETYPQSAAHREFLRKWQTRRQSAAAFRNWVREFDTSRNQSSQ